MHSQRLRLFVAIVAALALGSVATASATVPYPPYQAGVKIAIAGERYQCTGGFSVLTAEGAPAALTAGHCASHGAVKVRGETIGSIQGSGFICCRHITSDSALMTLNGESIPNVGGIGPAEASLPVAGMIANVDLQIGMRVCSSGAFGGYRCGPIYRKNYSYRFPSGKLLSGLACAHFPVSHGDSGGPVFAVQEGTVLAAGLVSIGGPKTMCFARIEDALNYWGVTLSTQPPVTS